MGGLTLNKPVRVVWSEKNILMWNKGSRFSSNTMQSEYVQLLCTKKES